MFYTAQNPTYSDRKCQYSNVHVFGIHFVSIAVGRRIELPASDEPLK